MPPPARAPAAPRTRFGFTGHCQRVVTLAGGDHAHGEIELNLVCGGELRYRFAGGAVRFPTGRWIAYWAALPHRVLTVAGETHLAWITVPLDTYLGWCSGAHAQRLLAGEILCQGEPHPAAEERGREWTAILRSGDEGRRAIVALEVEALVRRLDLACVSLPCEAGVPPPALPRARQRDSRRLAGAPRPGSLSLVETMCGFLASHYREEIGVRECAAAAGIHQHYAMGLFQRACGTTIGQYLRRLRLAHAQRLLLTTGDGVLPIALTAGFGSQARFYVAFRQAYGVSPGAYRRAHRLLERPAHPPGEW